MPSRVYREACDASAAARIANSGFFVAASDEDCVLRVYDRERPGRPVNRLDVTAFLEPDDEEDAEADLEGAAQIHDRIYWIGSHGRSKKGREKKIRQRLFATTIEAAGSGFELRTTARPYTRLLADMAAAPALREFNLAVAATLKPEEPGGLNIEGLAPTADNHLLIGFRNPIPDEKALIMRLRNPGELVDGTARAAALDVAGRLDLGGRGIRALEFVPSRGMYIIIAGAFNNAGNFRLYRWSGKSQDAAAPMEVEVPTGISPEELIVFQRPDGSHVVDLLSDDGDAAVGGTPCKEAEPKRRTFRVETVSIEI